MQMTQHIQTRIYEIRGERVLLDFDLAELYAVETRVLNQAVKRNANRFPEDFMFRLTALEWERIWSQIAPASENSNPSSQIVMMDLPKNRTEKYLPYAFTEHGVAMLASVLKSKKAIDMNIAIVRAFIAIRQLIHKHKDVSAQMHEFRLELQSRIGEHDVQLAAIYDALENLLDKKEEENEMKQNWGKRERIGFKK